MVVIKMYFAELSTNVAQTINSHFFKILLLQMPFQTLPSPMT